MEFGSRGCLWRSKTNHWGVVELRRKPPIHGPALPFQNVASETKELKTKLDSDAEVIVAKYPQLREQKVAACSQLHDYGCSDCMELCICNDCPAENANINWKNKVSSRNLPKHQMSIFWRLHLAFSLGSVTKQQRAPRLLFSVLITSCLVGRKSMLTVVHRP